MIDVNPARAWDIAIQDAGGIAVALPRPRLRRAANRGWPLHTLERLHFGASVVTVDSCTKDD